MPGVFRLSIADLVKECRALAKLGIRAVALFPKLEARLKDEEGTAALREDALILRAVRAVKKAAPGADRHDRHRARSLHDPRARRRADRRRRRRRQ